MGQHEQTNVHLELYRKYVNTISNLCPNEFGMNTQKSCSPFKIQEMVTTIFIYEHILQFSNR